MNDVVRKVVIQGEERGLEGLKTKLEGVAVAHDKVASATSKSTPKHAAYRAAALSLQAAQGRVALAQARVNDLMAQGPQPMERMTKATNQLATAQATLVRAQARVSATSGEGANGFKAMAKESGMALATSRQLTFQLVDMGQAMATLPTMGIYGLQNLGFQVAQIGQLYMGQGGFNQAIKDSGKQLAGFSRYLGRGALGVLKFARAHPVALAGTVALSAGLGGLVSDLRAAGHESVGMSDVIVAAFQVTADAVGTFLKPAIEAIGPYFSAAWNWATSAMKDAGNGIIRLGVNTVNALRLGFAKLGEYFATPIAWGANKVIGILNSVTESSLIAVNFVIDQFNRIPGVDMGRIEVSGFMIPKIDASEFAASSAAAASAAQAAMREAWNTDYLGRFGDAIKSKVISNLQAAAEEGKKTGTAVKKAAEKGLKPWNLLGQEQKKVSEGLEHTKGVFKGFLSDLRNGIQEGKGFWESLKNAGLNALNKIADRAFDLLTDNLFAMLLGGMRGGPTLALNAGSMFGGMPPVYGNGTNYHPGGLAIVGDRGPEAIKLPRGSQVIPNHQIGRAMQPANNNRPSNVNININLAGANGDKEIERIARQAAEQGIRQAAPGIMQGSVKQAQQSFNRQPARWRSA